jgi:catalase
MRQYILWLKVKPSRVILESVAHKHVGRPVQDPTAQTVLRGSPLKGGGLALLSDTQLIETLAHFPRERIPERYVDNARSNTCFIR